MLKFRVPDLDDRANKITLTSSTCTINQTRRALSYSSGSNYAGYLIDDHIRSLPGLYATTLSYRQVPGPSVHFKFYIRMELT